jgi:hypothetical protein
MPAQDLRRAIVVNKRAVLRIEFPSPHTLATFSNGWRIDFTGPGEVRVIGETGGHDLVAVAAGDFVIANGEEYYVSRLNGGGFLKGGA